MRSNAKIALANCFLLLTAFLFIKAGCSKSNEDIDSGEIPAADQYVTWNLNNAKGSLQSPSDSLFGYVNSGSTSIHGGTTYNAPSPIYFSAAFNGLTTGTFSLTDLNIMTNGRYYINTSTSVQVTVTTYGNAGQYLIGSYAGTVKDSTSNGQTSTAVYPIHGNFKVKRLN
ncbi:MAG TPA: hypothetical protein VFT06_14515 [Flavisolibacter sp.]|nr:hypothetical protein [Flavisolibacter sp.]